MIKSQVAALAETGVRETDCVAIGKITHPCLLVLPGLIRNPLLFERSTLLDAGSVIPDVIRDRHDRHKLNAFLNFDTASRLISRFPTAHIGINLKGFVHIIGSLNIRCFYYVACD